LKEQGGRPQIVNIRGDKFPETSKPQLKDGDFLADIRNVRGFVLARQHFQSVAVVLVVGFAVGLQVHIYSTSYIAPSDKHGTPDKPLEWDKIASFDETSGAKSDAKVRVVVDALKSKFAHEVRNLARKKNEMT
jgi:hypothetical protein